MPVAHIGAQRASRHLRAPSLRALLSRRVHVTALAALLAVSLVPVQAPAPAKAAGTEASRVVAHGKIHRGAPWRYGATGPNAFDCSGFVYHTFSATGLAGRIGGKRSSAGYYSYFRSLGRANRSNPRLGDLVVYGYSGRVSHIGIYIGNGYTISTLTSGVKVHRTFAVNKPFIAYLHVRLTR